MASPWTNNGGIPHDINSRKIELWKVVYTGMEAGRWVIGDYVDWGSKYNDDSVFSDMMSDINTYLALFNMTLYNPTGTTYQLVSL